MGWQIKKLPADPPKNLNRIVGPAEKLDRMSELSKSPRKNWLGSDRSGLLGGTQKIILLRSKNSKYFTFFLEVIGHTHFVLKNSLNLSSGSI